MPMVEHTGETIEDKPSDVSQILLDYGWVIPAAAAAGYGVKKAADTVQGIKGRKQKPVEAVPQEDIIDVTAREVTPTEKPFSQAKQLPAPTQTVAAPATQAAPAAPGPVAPPAANWSQAQVSMPPVAPPGAPAPEAAPKPVDPLQEARIRKANAEAAMAEHKLQQLQSGVKTTPASKTSAAPVSEAEMQMIQKSGAASASKELQAMEAANKIAPAVDPIQATATPAEKQAAVAVVEKTKPESVVKKTKAAVPPGMTKEEAGMMNHLLGMYGGKDDPFSMKAYEQVKEILGYTPAYQTGKGGSLSAEETGKVLGWRKENVPGPKVNLTHDMKKVLKAGAPAAVAAMILTPEFAKASTTEKRQIIGESLLPIGITPTELAPGTLTEKQLKAYENAQKLGSPYRSIPPPR